MACSLAAPSTLCGSPVLTRGKSGLFELPLWHTIYVPHWSILPLYRGGFWLHWLTSQARYVRVYLPRRAMHASYESPWHFSAKRDLLTACFPLMARFRTRFSPHRMAYAANVQRLIGCLYTLRYFYIPTCRFTAQDRVVPRGAFLESLARSRSTNFSTRIY